MRSSREEPAFGYHFWSAGMGLSLFFSASWVRRSGRTYGFIAGVPDPEKEEDCAVEEPTGFAGCMTGAAFLGEFDEVVDSMELARSGTEGVAAAFSLGRGGNGLLRLGEGFEAELEEVLLLVAALISRRDPSRSYRSANRG